MFRLFLSFILLFSLLNSEEPPKLALANKYSGDLNVTGWMMSEKLDGVRAFWDGERLVSRGGNLFAAPSFFTENFPPFPLDGELWTKRGDFAHIASIVNDGTPSMEWREITYNIFEVPFTDGNFSSRLQKAEEWFKNHLNQYVNILKQTKCESNFHLKKFLKKLETKGAEGVMLKNPSALYETGRSDHLLKVKSFDDMEGRVIGYKEGSGKFAGSTGALLIEIENGIRFYLGSGFTKEERKNPPEIGTIITFKHYGFTKNKKPRFASFLRVREEL